MYPEPERMNSYLTILILFMFIFIKSEFGGEGTHSKQQHHHHHHQIRTTHYFAAIIIKNKTTPKPPPINLPLFLFSTILFPSLLFLFIAFPLQIPPLSLHTAGEIGNSLSNFFLTNYCAITQIFAEMPSIGVKLYSVFFKLMLKHRLQNRLQGPDNDAVGGGMFGVTSRPEEETVAAANPSFSDGVATKDIHIDPLTSLSIRIFLPDTCLHFADTLARSHRNPELTRRNSDGSSGGNVFVSSSNGGQRAQRIDNGHRRSSNGGSSVDDKNMRFESGSYRGYNPAGNSRRRLPVMLQIHGGGFFSGSNDSAANDFFCRRMAKLCDVMVLAVGYRLAPENKYPAAFEDGLKVLHWVAKQAKLAECSKSLGRVGRSRSEGNWYVANAFGASMVEPWLAAHADPSRFVLHCF